MQLGWQFWRHLFQVQRITSIKPDILPLYCQGVSRFQEAPWLMAQQIRFSHPCQEISYIHKSFNDAYPYYVTSTYFEDYLSHSLKHISDETKQN